MTRESDALLAGDLRAVGLHDLAERAETGEWNDYFGVSATPELALLAILSTDSRLSPHDCATLRQNVMDGRYDGTNAEADEWMRSPEGTDVVAELARKGIVPDWVSTENNRRSKD